MKIAGLSSKKLGDSYEGQLKNNYLYQGAYSELDEDIGWHDFYLRNYDAQIGRWVQQDPYQQYASPYVGMGNDPVNNTDPSGGSTEVYNVIKIGGEMSKTAATAITLGEVVIRSVSTISKSVSSISTVMKIANITAKVFQVANVLNSSINTIQVGKMLQGLDLGMMRNEALADKYLGPFIKELEAKAGVTDKNFSEKVKVGEFSQTIPGTRPRIEIESGVPQEVAFIPYAHELTNLGNMGGDNGINNAYKGIKEGKYKNADEFATKMIKYEAEATYNHLKASALMGLFIDGDTEATQAVKKSIRGEMSKGKAMEIVKKWVKNKGTVNTKVGDKIIKQNAYEYYKEFYEEATKK